VDEQSIAVRQIDREYDVWMGDYKLPPDAVTVELTGCASDMAGNDTCVTSTFSSMLLCAGQGGTLSSPDGRMSVTVDAGAMSGRAHLIVLPCGEGEPPSIDVARQGSSLRLLACEGMIPSIYYVGPRGALGGGSAYLEFHYTDSDIGANGAPDHLHIEQVGAGPLECYVDVESRTVSAEVTELGEFCLVLGSPGSSKVADPRYLRMQPSFPNPFAGSATIKFQVRAAQNTKVTVYDVRGRAVAHLLDESVYPGGHEVHWDGTGFSGQRVASGLYIIRVETEYSSSTSKIVRLR
jgi:hypothetical protein